MTCTDSGFSVLRCTLYTVAFTGCGFLSGVVVGDAPKKVGVPSRETGRSVGDVSFGEDAKNEDLRSARVETGESSVLLPEGDASR